MSKSCIQIPEAGARVGLHGDVYYVKATQLADVAGKSGGCTLEFRSCVWTKTGQTTRTIAFLALLDIAVSFLLEYSIFVVQSIFISVLCIYLLLAFPLSTYKEVVLVVPGLGVQISSSNWLGYTSSVFLPHTIIGDIIINEGITRCKVVFYLAVMVVRDKTDPHPRVSKLYPLFTDFYPRLPAIQDAYHLLRTHSV